MMVPIQVIRWYRQCYDGTDSCAIVVPIRRYSHYRLSYLQRCISFESYIKPQQSQYRACLWCVVYLLNPTSNHNKPALLDIITMLYIFWILHQTTTAHTMPCAHICCISFESYIKPQHYMIWAITSIVVYLLNPTSNHNGGVMLNNDAKLYIFWLLHQTTTSARCGCEWWWLYIFWLLHQTTTVWLTHRIKLELYIFWLLHQTTTDSRAKNMMLCCISFDSYIKPQLVASFYGMSKRCISFDSYIKPQHRPRLHRYAPVVYLLTPTSNHNVLIVLHFLQQLYIFWLLHQTTTCRAWATCPLSCISFDSYIKPQRMGIWR